MIEAAEPAVDVPLKPLKLFLSYGRDEYAAEALALKQALEQRGHQVWFDQEQLGHGLDWEHRIEQGLAWCDCVVLTMTPHSVRRPDGYCLNEIAKALERQCKIIPVLMVTVPDGAPVSISRIQYLDWTDAVPAVDRPDRFQVRLARLCEAIEQDKLDFEGGQQRLQRYLQPLNYDGDIRCHVARFEGRKLLEVRIREWLHDPAASQVLWLTGSPGLGKSAIAAWLAHRWGEAAAMHFCQAGNQDKADPARAILSIAYQLSQRLDLYRARIANLELERESQKDARTLFDTLLVGPLARDYPAPPQPCLVILDGLDEATRADGSNPLAELVGADWGRLPHWLRLLVSSRPDAEVQQWLGGTETLALDGDDVEQQADLKTFLARQLQDMDRPVTEAVLQRILAASQGAFHYAVLLLEDVRESRCNPEDPVDLPAGMNQIYRQTFGRRFPDATRYETECRPHLALILAAPEPVPLEVLAGASGMDVFEVRQRLTLLGSMVAMERAEKGWSAGWDTVRLAHASLRSWLTGLDNRSRMPLAHRFTVQVGTKRLAREILKRWDQGQPAKDKDEKLERHGFVCRVVWALIESAGDRDAMDRIALDVSLYWEHRKLALATAPGEHAARVSSALAASGQALAEQLAHAGKCLSHWGDLLLATGKSASALVQFRKDLEISERLAAQDPDNTGWQSDLSVSYNRIGGILESQGDLAAALVQFRKDLEIRERLAARYPDNAGWQSDLGATYNRIGGILESRGDLAAALVQFRKDLEISERLAAQYPDNAGWQSDLGATYNRIGGVLESRGDLAAALVQFRKDLEISERLAAQDPDNAGWQRNLGVSYNRIGDVLESQGDLAAALLQFRKALEISERLAAQDPDNAGWQSNLGLSYNRIGGILKSQGDLAAALVQLRKDLEISERLAAQDPNNAGWQSDLGATYNRIGGILKSQGDLAAALLQFRKALEISERLAAQDPNNAGWQRNLGVNYNRIGDILESQGDLAAALLQFRKDLEISERLAVQDPNNAGWQSDLGATYNRIGGVLESRGDLAAALLQFRKALEISERLAAQDPDNAGWQRELGVRHNRIGFVLEAQGDISAAQSEFQVSSILFAILRDTDDAGSMIDHAAAMACLAECHEATGEGTAALALDLQIVEIDWTPDAIVGTFRKKSIPKIAARLDAVFDQCEPDFRAPIAKRCLGGLEAVGVTDLAVWRVRVEQLKLPI
jgi:tetratricopeptide (TPR) repeat protein